MKKILTIVSVLVLIIGCQDVAKSPRYALTLKNGTTNAIEEAGIKFDGYRFDWGNFSPGRSKSDRIVPNAVPKEATIYWKGEDGKLNEQTTEVRSMLPKDFAGGDIVFTIVENEKVVVTNQPFLRLPK